MSKDIKECSHHQHKRRKCIQRLCATLLILIFLTLFVILLVWAILKPHKPHFILQDATIFNFNVSAPYVLSATIQVTIYSHNPNSRIGIYYDKSDVYANYRSQQITYYTSIPPVYQGHKDNNVWSPFIYGNNVPIAPYNGISLQQDQSTGAVWLMIKLSGRVKWKVGSVTTGRYHLRVSCPAYIPFGSKSSGIQVNNGGIGIGMKYTLQQDCEVSV